MKPLYKKMIVIWGDDLEQVLTDASQACQLINSAGDTIAFGLGGEPQKIEVPEDDPQFDACVEEKYSE